MFERVTSRFPRTALTRTHATVLAAGLGASVALGTGVAVAAAQSTPAASGSTSVVQTQAQAVAAQADATKTQAATVQKAAEAAEAAEAAKAAKVAAEKSAAAKKQASWVSPVKNYQLSASFAQNGGMWAAKHSGQDYAVPSGTPVAATHGGTVVKAGGNGAGDGPAYGNAVVIKHGSGTYSQYAHMSSVNVTAGQVVKTGQTIGRSGNTGNSSGPHLHFEIRTTPNYGSAVDPAAFLRSHGVHL